MADNLFDAVRATSHHQHLQLLPRQQPRQQQSMNNEEATLLLRYPLPDAALSSCASRNQDAESINSMEELADILMKPNIYNVPGVNNNKISLGLENSDLFILASTRANQNLVDEAYKIDQTVSPALFGNASNSSKYQMSPGDFVPSSGKTRNIKIANTQKAQIRKKALQTQYGNLQMKAPRMNKAMLQRKSKPLAERIFVAPGQTSQQSRVLSGQGRPASRTAVRASSKNMA